MNFVTENLLGESQQPSIRYQLEWLYILLFTNNKDKDSGFDIWNSLTKVLIDFFFYPSSTMKC